MEWMLLANSSEIGGSASPLEDVVRHVNLRQTREAACGGGLRSATTAAADGTELSIERGFEYPQDKILEVIGHGFRLKVGKARKRTSESQAARATENHQVNRNPNCTSRGSPGPPEASPAMGGSVSGITPKVEEARSR